MPKVVGIDFSTLNNYRTAVTIRLFNGDEVELPLIKVRDAAIAENLLHRNDNLAVQINALQLQFERKATDAGRIADGLKDDETSEELNSDRGAKIIETTMTQLYDMQAKTAELHKRCSALCTEIHEFLAPYLEGTSVLKQLDEVDYNYTITVLSLMLYGEEFLTKSEDNGEAVEDKNPTTTLSQPA